MKAKIKTILQKTMKEDILLIQCDPSVQEILTDYRVPFEGLFKAEVNKPTWRVKRSDLKSIPEQTVLNFKGYRNV